jgi:hypothetical protein
VIFGAVAPAQVGKPSGAASPEEAVAALQKASAANDMLRALTVISPDGLKEIANEGVTGVLMVLAFSDPNDPMPGGPKLSKAELDAQRKKYTTAMDLAKATLKPYGLDVMIGKPVLAEDTQKAINAALDKADNLALVTSLYGALTKIGPLLGLKQDPKPTMPVTVGTVTGYKTDGDRATAQNGAETMQFVRIDGRWFIEPPAPNSSSGPSSPPSPEASGPAPRTTATGKVPEVAVGGVQIARVIVPGDEFSAKPFQSDNGTKIVLWVKMPAGQGLIDIDEDASLLQSVGDDKGTNIGGKYGSFPRVFKDGSGGTIEIASTGFPAAGATAVLADGSLAMSVASGTRKTRVANVRLQNDAKFTFEKTPMAVAEVGAEGDAQTFTLKLPRRVMESIKDVVFLDAKGQPIEGRRTGSGYMNDAGEMSFSLNSTAKTVTLEFEAWQGLRVVKIPFKVKAGLAFE